MWPPKELLFSENPNENLNERKVERLLGYSPDGASVVVGHYDFSSQREAGVVFYDAATGELQRSIPVPSSLRPWWIDFSGQTIGAVGSGDTTLSGIQVSAIGRADVVLLDLATGQERLRLRGHDGFDHYALSPDGSRLALGKRPPPLIRGHSELSLWSLKTGRRLQTLKCEGSFRALSFSPDGNRLVAVFSGGATDSIKPIQIWDATPLPEPIAR
jgi:WD40 repeat protein